ncbi:MAG: ribbon-helix-helix domain-containing protein [Alphaproteobacteria bacterium]|nr:ribbon-helix-helix domain-containing protein [Alphaproteobacteria bacterium]MBU1561590.1 ribbon-helix-helix domain-containing protein [Alphaproteobacteria bacterium]MBU2302950.1 ribbon-helix-helix domain-containing protein [Alphaproteobacteria bacterium]MBU2368709.1 ribbon-helix-helix domain-containing protein [Alphaproteobacteria bacterium]
MSDNEASDWRDGLAEPEPEAPTWAVPVFRTVVTESGRHGLRLEGAFWDAIARMARLENRKTSDMVRELLGQARPSGVNASSTIRSAVVKRLLDESARIAPLATPLAVVKLLQMAPTPSFALDRNKHLVRVNDEFVRYLRTVLSKSGPVEKAQLILDRPAEALFAELEPGMAIECGLSIKVDNHERRTQARIIIPPPAPAAVLVGFIIH